MARYGSYKTEAAAEAAEAPDTDLHCCKCGNVSGGTAFWWDTRLWAITPSGFVCPVCLRREAEAQAEAEEAAQPRAQVIVCTPNGKRGAWADTVPMLCTAVRAERYTGRGDASLHYFARTLSGEWVAFRKADNRRIKLPIDRELTWLPPVADPNHKHGPYGAYAGAIIRSEEVAF